MQISSLQIITNSEEPREHVAQIQALCEAGADWIQLRLKDCDEQQAEEIARKCLNICNEYNCKLIINDKVELAKKIAAHGVHIGKNDMLVSKAREILGNNFIIGGTCNTIDDVRDLFKEGVDYIGLGPFRFTQTKKNLSPVLGVEGYRQILSQMKEEDIHIPVVGIGGVCVEDISDLRATGLHGIAVSSQIVNSENIREQYNLFKEELQRTK